MGSLLRGLLVAAYFAAAVFPCAASEAGAPAPEIGRAFSAHALHTHGEGPPGRASELRAPCPCGCDERPVATLGSGSLGAALLPARVEAELPRAAHFTATENGARLSPARLPDPVPRLA
jgi:hypothetical protein